MTEPLDDTPEPQTAPEDDDAPQRPKVALMGEFSAGKSTLTNLLLGADPLPVKITATRLPPVWITHGTDTGLREDLDGTIHPLDDSGLDGINMDDTRLIQLQMTSDILKICDLVDMPGISDPNMASEVWSDVIDQADLLIWCTHATQAWRQSEAAAFESLPEHLRENAVLLITRFDKITSERDRKRVLARVKAETDGRFRAIFPVSLLDALQSNGDQAKWDRSGAEPFVKTLLDLLLNPGKPVEDQIAAPEATAAEEPKAEIRKISPVRPVRVKPKGRSMRPPQRGASSDADNRAAPHG